MSAAHKIARWASYKTVAGLLDCSVSEVRARVYSGAWRTRRIGKGRRAHRRIALGSDNFPLGAERG